MQFFPHNVSSVGFGDVQLGAIVKKYDLLGRFNLLDVLQPPLHEVDLSHQS